MDQQNLQNQINSLTQRLDQLGRSSDITRTMENSLRERLGLNTTADTFISGKATMVAGSVDVVDSRILTTSVAVASPVSSVSPALGWAVAVLSGKIVIFEGGGSSTATFNYIIKI